MEVHLTSRQEAFLEREIVAGRFANTDEAVREAVSLLEEHDPTLGRAVHDFRSGRAVVDAFRASPHKDIELEQPRPAFAPVRDTEW